MDRNDAYILPLDSLFQRLELAGFNLSPSDRLRAWQVLSGPGKNYVNDPAGLKTILAPVLSKSTTDQEKFYELFDLFYEEINRPLNIQVAPQRLSFWWLLPVLILLSFLLINGIWGLLVSHPPEAVAITGPEHTRVGETVTFFSVFPESMDTSGIKGSWEYHNIGNDEIEKRGAVLDSFSFITPPSSQGNYNKEVRFNFVTEDTIVTTITHQFLVRCDSLPAVGRINGKVRESDEHLVDFWAVGEPNPLKTFKVDGRIKLESPASKWVFHWDFDDGKTAEGFMVSHYFDKEGQYNVTLQVQDTTAAGFCDLTFSKNIRIGQEKVFLTAKGFQKDVFSLVGQWAWAFWLIMGLVGIVLLYYFARWLEFRRRAYKAAEPKAAATQYKISDRAPYFIPLQNKDKLILSSQKILRFADSLRIRQRGFRKELDVLATLQSTIDKGGFPELEYKHVSNPSEYLFLIDEQSRESHLGRLFRHLVNLLEEQDVNIEVYYFRRHLNRFWHKREEEGISLEMLYRLYGNYRLICCGDLHELIEPFAKEQPQLRPAQANIIKQWKKAYLFTSVPPVSWTYREKVLARYFNIYPCDIDGIATAAQDMENDTDPLVEGMPYEEWQSLLENNRSDSGTEYRKWRRLRDVDDYLSAYDPDLRKWFLSLAVFPKVRWEMTLAIGNALEVPLTVDNILVLARIPVLQKDYLDEKLRQQMLESLDPVTEQIARKCVKKELESVKSITAGSHANYSLSTNLAVQSFALEPHSQENRDAIRLMLNSGAMNKGAEKELDRVAEKMTTEVQKQSKVQSNIFNAPQGKSLQEWLEEDAPKSKKKEKIDIPIFTTDLWKALAASLVFIALMFIASKWDQSPQLHQVFFKERSVESASSKLRNYGLIKEKVLIDSAILYNNKGVDQMHLSSDTSAATWFLKALKAAEPGLPGKTDFFEGQGYPYAIANKNLATVYYDEAVRIYNTLLNEGIDTILMEEASALFEKAYRTDSLALDIRHAQGLIDFYTNEHQDRNLSYYNDLEAVRYFDTLSYSPNLSTLMGQEHSRILKITAENQEDGTIRVLVDLVATKFPYEDYILEVFATQEDDVLSDTSRTEVKVGIHTKSLILSHPEVKKGRAGSSSLSEKIMAQIVGPTGDLVAEKNIDFQHQWEVVKNNTNTSSSEVNNTQNNTNVTVDPERELSPMTPDQLPPEQQQELLQREDSIRASQINFLKPQTVLVSGGSFIMGCQSADRDGDCADNERPAHEVTVGSFNMAKTEVTNEQFALFLNAEGNQEEGGRTWLDLQGNSGGERCRIQETDGRFLVEVGYEKHPIIFVSWYGARAYAAWLSKETGEPYRLPTEQEWEFAARGGVKGIASGFLKIYSGSVYINDVGWSRTNSGGRLHPVNDKSSNRLVIYDMSGNVWEWCSDTWSSYNPEPLKGRSGSGGKVVRGGAWSSRDTECRVAARREEPAGNRSNNIGFRLVRSTY